MLQLRVSEREKKRNNNKKTFSLDFNNLISFKGKKRHFSALDDEKESNFAKDEKKFNYENNFTLLKYSMFVWPLGSLKLLSILY